MPLFAGVLAEETCRLPSPAILAIIRRSSGDVGTLAMRIGLAVTLGLSALGGLPRHGTALWSEPTLFVPDMALGTMPGWDCLASAALIVSLLLLFGLATRLAAIAVVALSITGCLVYGQTFVLHYAGHFIAPGILLAFYGAGKCSLDRLLPMKHPAACGLPDKEYFWGIAQLLTGFTFVGLAVTVKFAQPTLLIAILDHASFGFFGIPFPLLR